MDSEFTEIDEPELVEAILKNSSMKISSLYDSSIIGVCVKPGERQEQKCKKGRRKSGSKKHRAGKNRKRKYKPYYKLTLAERQKLDERNEKRANRKREYLHSCGVSLAPLNTTQFIFNDMIEGDSSLQKFEEEDNSDASSLSEDGRNDDFLEMWNRKRFEDFQLRELVQWFMSLQDEVEQAEELLNVENKKIKIFQEEIRRYELENEALTKLNDKLVKILKDMPCKDEKVDNKKHQPLEMDISSADAGPAL